jgi:uncharacterized protein YaaN involved in tellurite resistance
MINIYELLKQYDLNTVRKIVEEEIQRNLNKIAKEKAEIVNKRKLLETVEKKEEEYIKALSEYFALLFN